MRVKGILLFSVITVSTAIIGLTFAFPSLDDLWLENPFWNGLSKVYSRMEPARLKHLRSLSSVMVDPSNTTILLLGPSKPFAPEEIENVKVFLSSGGSIVLADEFGTGNSLLEGLGLDVRFSKLLLIDLLFKDRNSQMPRILFVGTSVFTGGVEELILNYPTALTNTESIRVLAWSSPYSYLATDTSPPDEDSVYEPLPVVAVVTYGKGVLILISDSSLFINSMLDRGDNLVLLSGVTRGRVFLDEAHSIPSRLAVVKAFIVSAYSFMRMTEIRYGFAVLMIFTIVKVKWVVGEAEEEEDEVESVLHWHPEWNRELLEELHEGRRRALGAE